MAEENKNPEKIDFVPYNQETVETENPISAYAATDSEEDKERARMFRNIHGADDPVLSPKSRMILAILATVLISIVLFIAYFLFKGAKDLL